MTGNWVSMQGTFRHYSLGIAGAARLEGFTTRGTEGSRVDMIGVCGDFTPPLALLGFGGVDPSASLRAGCVRPYTSYFCPSRRILDVKARP
jgi:hypothetical protein